MTSNPDTDLEPHLALLLAELHAIQKEQEGINATSTACAYWHAAQTCERFLTTPPAWPQQSP